MVRQYQLCELVSSYDPSTDEGLLNKAYVFAITMHGKVKRASGDWYWSHPVEVAGILAEMRLDYRTIITALLHDTIEDTDASYELIEKEFGSEIARLVDGVTKLSRIRFPSDKARQAENFRKFVIAAAEDTRVLLVKLADRLHNMRTLHHVSQPEKRARIAGETREIFAPLAERIGLQNIRSELEDLAFRHLSPEAHQLISTRLQFLAEQEPDIIREISAEFTETCARAGLEVEISGRRKSAYSVWSKMERKHVEFENLSDVVAFRVIVPEREDCYRALGILHGAYQMVPGRFKDFVSTPKPNGYQSIHTDVMGPKLRRVEIQIRSREMHEVAELGVAAHWSYKQGETVNREGRRYNWMRRLLEILEDASSPEEFLEHTKLEMYQDLVFCFTPKGELISLPRGATPIDFAYAVHSEIGDTCVGARINGRMLPLWTRLRNGDQVEVATSSTSTPSPSWEEFAVTGRARASIRRHVRQQKREQFCSLGTQQIERVFRQQELPCNADALETARSSLGYDHADDLRAAVGASTLKAETVLQAAFPGVRRATQGRAAPPVRKPRGRSLNGTIPIKGLTPGVAVHYAQCCHPLPGERIVGIRTTGKGVTVHTIDCEVLEGFQSMPEMWVDVSWDRDNDAGLHIGRLAVVLANEPGSLGTVSTIIGRNDGNIINLKITSRSTDFFELLIDVEVTHLRHLNHIIAALRASPMITSIDRARDDVVPQQAGSMARA